MVQQQQLRRRLIDGEYLDINAAKPQQQPSPPPPSPQQSPEPKQQQQQQPQQRPPVQQPQPQPRPPLELPGRVTRHPMIEETPEWIAEYAAKTGRKEEEIRREVEQTIQRVEQRAEAVRESRVVEAQQPAARAGEAPQQQQQPPPQAPLTPQDAVNLLTKSVKSTLEDLERAFRERDVSSLSDILRRMGIDTVEIELHGAVNKIPVEKLPEYLNSLGWYERAVVLEQLRIKYGQQDPAELAARIAPHVFKSFGVDAKVESTPAAHVINLGDVEVVINRITKEIAARFTDQYVSRINSELARLVEAGDVEGVREFLKQLPEGVREKLGDYYTAWAEFYRKYGVEINALTKQLEKTDKPGEILEKLNSLLEKASNEYSQLLSRGVPSHMYSTYDAILTAVNKLREHYARQLEVYRYLKQVSEAGGGIEGLAKLASLVPPSGAPSTFKIDDKTSVQITGTGYAIVKINDKPLFAVDKIGRIFVAEGGGVTNMEIKPDYAGFALYLARKGIDASEAASIAYAASVFGAESVLGDLYNVARKLGERLELGNVIISPNSITVNGKEFKVVDVKGGRPIVSTEYGPATLEAALQLEAVKEAAKKAVSLDPTKGFSPTAGIPQIEITPIKTSGIVTGFHVAPITKFELALPRLVDIGGVAVPYATEEGLDKSHKFTVTVKPTPDGMYKVRIVGEGIDKEGVVKDVNAFIRSAIAEFYTAKYGAPAIDFIAALNNPEKAQASVDLKEYAQWLRDALAGKAAAMSTPQSLAFLYGVAKGLGVTDLTRTIFLDIPASIAGIFSSDASKQLTSISRFWETYERELSRIRSQEFGAGTSAGLAALAVASFLAALPSGGATLAALGARAAAGARAAVGATALSKVLTAAEFASATATGIAASVGAVQTALATARGYDPLTVANDYLNVVSITSLLGLGAGGAKWVLLRVKPEALDSLAKLYANANEAIVRAIDEAPGLSQSFAKALGVSVDMVGGELRRVIKAADKLAGAKLSIDASGRFVAKPVKLSNEEVQALVKFAEGARRLGKEIGVPEEMLPNPANIISNRPEAAVAEFYKALEVTLQHGVYNAIRHDLYQIANRDPQRFLQLYEKYKESIANVAKNFTPDDVYNRVFSAAVEMGLSEKTAAELAKRAQWGWTVGFALVDKSFSDVLNSPALRGKIAESARIRYPELKPLEEIERVDVDKAFQLLRDRLGDEALAKTVAGYLRNRQFLEAYREFYAGKTELDAVLYRLAGVLFPKAHKSAVKQIMAELRMRGVTPEELEEVLRNATVKEAVHVPPPKGVSPIADLVVRRPMSEVIADLVAALEDSQRLVTLYKVPEPIAVRLSRLSKNVKEKLAELWIKAILGKEAAAEKLRQLLRRLNLPEKEVDKVFTRAVTEQKTTEQRPAETGGGGEQKTVVEVEKPATRETTEQRPAETSQPRTAATAIVEKEVEEPTTRAATVAVQQQPLLLNRPVVIRPVSGQRMKIGPLAVVQLGEAKMPLWIYSLGLPVSAKYTVFQVKTPAETLKVYVPETPVQRLLIETETGQLYLATPTTLSQITVTSPTYAYPTYAVAATEPSPAPVLPQVEVRPIPPGGGYPSWWYPLSQYWRDLLRLLYQREMLKI